jgi:hypothetical protein
MGNKTISVLTVMGFLLAVTITSSSAPALAVDKTPPSLDSCTVTPNSISNITGGTVTVSLKTTSINGLSGTPAVMLINNQTSKTISIFNFDQPASGNLKDTTWVQTVNIKPNLEPGVYQLNIYPLHDVFQNYNRAVDCVGQFVAYGVPIPSPTPTVSLTPTPTPTRSPSYDDLKYQINILTNDRDMYKSQLADLKSYYSKVLSDLNSRLNAASSQNMKLASCVFKLKSSISSKKPKIPTGC